MGTELVPPSRNSIDHPWAVVLRFETISHSAPACRVILQTD